MPNADEINTAFVESGFFEDSFFNYNSVFIPAPFKESILIMNETLDYVEAYISENERLDIYSEEAQVELLQYYYDNIASCKERGDKSVSDMGRFKYAVYALFIAFFIRTIWSAISHCNNVIRFMPRR